MANKKPKYALFAGAEDASEFLRSIFAQAKAIKDKYQKRLFILELKASPKYKTALSCLGRKRQSSEYDHHIVPRRCLIEDASKELDLNQMKEFYKWNRRQGQP